MPVFPKYTVPFFVHFRESRMEIVFESLPLMSNSWQNIAGETFFFFFELDARNATQLILSNSRTTLLLLKNTREYFFPVKSE